MDALTLTTLTTHERNLELWLSRIRDCRSSGQTVSDWCNMHDIGIKSYYYWMRKIKRETFDSLPAVQKRQNLSPSTYSKSFVEIPVNVPSAGTGAAIVIRFQGMVLEIQSGADAVTIENTLRVINNLC